MCHHIINCISTWIFFRYIYIIIEPESNRVTWLLLVIFRLILLVWVQISKHVSHTLVFGYFYVSIHQNQIHPDLRKPDSKSVNVYYNSWVFAHSSARHVSVLWAPLLKSVKKCQAHGSNPGYWDINTNIYTTKLNDTLYIDGRT